MKKFWRDEFTSLVLKQAFADFLCYSIEITRHDGNTYTLEIEEDMLHVVELTVENQEIVEAQCDCQYFGPTHLCKHVAMAMFRLFGADEEFDKYNKYFRDS